MFEKLQIFLLLLITVRRCASSPLFQTTSFNFTTFDANSRDILYEGDAFASGGVLQPTKNAQDANLNYSVGRATYRQPIRLFDKSSAGDSLASFTTRFSFVVGWPKNASHKGDGISFFLTPNGSTLPTDSNGANLGLLSNSHAAASVTAAFVAVEFDTFANPIVDPPVDHVGIDVNSIQSNASVGWYTHLVNGILINATVKYDSATKNLSARLTNSSGHTLLVAPGVHLIINLRDYLTEWVTIGFSGSTGQQTEIHKIYTWSFSSSLSVVANETQKHRNPKLPVVLGISAGAVVVIGFIFCFICFFSRIRKQRREKVKEVEVKASGPRKFSYNELAVATNNFSGDGLLGQGGFGRVYVGYLKDIRANVAIKSINPQSQQGMKEFAAEVETISQLRHKNLIQLIGWCHEKEKLLIVYEFMPNKSVDYHLFKEPCLLTWQQRYRIALDLASALFYLQEECEQCVLHRDIKLSNLLLNLNFNTKLGDFGLAKLVEHGQMSQTTGNLMGTEGYLAPEYLESTKASKETDIFSFGVVALQLASGRPAIGEFEWKDGVRRRLKLAFWFWDQYENGNKLAGVDPRLNGDYDEEQMSRLIIVGLACAHPNFLDRPSIREVVDILSIRAPLPQEMPKPIPGGINQLYRVGYSSASSLASGSVGQVSLASGSVSQVSSASMNSDSVKASRDASELLALKADALALNATTQSWV